MNGELVFLKLGGSLITAKDRPLTPRLEVITRLAEEIAAARSQDPGLRILLGHGSGSFGHHAADRYHTRQGVKSSEEWQGFIEVWRRASELNRLVMQALEKAGLPALALQPSAMITTRAGKIYAWNLEPLQAALAQDLLPVIYGDVAFDRNLGGTILSTEDLFRHLAPQMQPSRLLFAGLAPGVWADYPANTRLLPEITPASFQQVKAGVIGSSATDVTGGMGDKVRQILAMVSEVPRVEATIFSGEAVGNVRRSLRGEVLGTRLHSP